METFSVLLALCAGNSPVIGKFPAQRPVTRSFDVFGWVNNREAGDLRRHRAHYDVIVMRVAVTILEFFLYKHFSLNYQMDVYRLDTCLCLCPKSHIFICLFFSQDITFRLYSNLFVLICNQWRCCLNSLLLMSVRIANFSNIFWTDCDTIISLNLGYLPTCDFFLSCSVVDLH